jgi:hypothetical protein
VVGWGSGNFDPNNDPSRYNLVDPLKETTVEVPHNGWAAIRFRADNFFSGLTIKLEIQFLSQVNPLVGSDNLITWFMPGFLVCQSTSSDTQTAMTKTSVALKIIGTKRMEYI